MRRLNCKKFSKGNSKSFYSFDRNKKDEGEHGISGTAIYMSGHEMSSFVHSPHTFACSTQSPCNPTHTKVLGLANQWLYFNIN
jgi:hypothetical protein